MISRKISMVSRRSLILPTLLAKPLSKLKSLPQIWAGTLRILTKIWSWNSQKLVTLLDFLANHQCSSPYFIFTSFLPSYFLQESCSIDYSGHWPLGFLESDLTWAPNAKEDRTGPKYRLFSEKDVRHVLPNTQYNCKQICSTWNVFV